jgi:hypothetical protein
MSVRPKPSILSFCAAGALVALAACGGSQSTPTTPVPTPVAPKPTPAPTPTPVGVGIPPASSGCGEPYPPPLHQINMKVHVKAPEYYTLDSTPIVGPNLEYCTAIGYYDGRDMCPVRLEGDPQRRPCEAWLLGNAEDTGKPGPTWSRDWNYWCTTFEESGCQHNPDNPLSLFITLGGTYQACRGEDICGNLQVDR